MPPPSLLFASRTPEGGEGEGGRGAGDGDEGEGEGGRSGSPPAVSYS